MSSSITRRQFVCGAAAAAIAVPRLASARVLGAGDGIRMAVIGCGIRGSTLV